MRKKTLVKLLLGFYQNYEGRILIDSTDTKEVGLKDLRRSIRTFLKILLYSMDQSLKISAMVSR